MSIFHPAATAAEQRVLIQRLRGHVIEEIADQERVQNAAVERERLRQAELHRRREEAEQRYAALEHFGYRRLPIDWTKQKVDWKLPEPSKASGFGPSALIRRIFP